MSSQPAAIAVVTGGKSGLGKAIACKIASFPFVDKVLAVSRSIQPSDVSESTKIEALAADVATEQGRNAIVERIKELCNDGDDSNNTRTKQLRFLVHSAGIIDPIKSVLKVTPEELRRAMSVNCEAPLFLTTALYPYMAPIHDDSVAGRVLHVSSGAAHGAPPVGWGCYGISKAAFFQSYKVLEREFRDDGRKVIVGSFKPGVVDTSMQESIRGSSMPAVQVFKNMKEKVAEFMSDGESPKARPPPKGALDTPENVAFFVEYLLTGTTDDEFADKDNTNEFDTRNTEYFPEWIPTENLPKD